MCLSFLYLIFLPHHGLDASAFPLDGGWLLICVDILVFAGMAFILFIELSQLLCPERHTDIDDLILNTSGVLIGACIIFAIRKRRNEYD